MVNINCSVAFSYFIITVTSITKDSWVMLWIVWNMMQQWHILWRIFCNSFVQCVQSIGKWDQWSFAYGLRWINVTMSVNDCLLHQNFTPNYVPIPIPYFTLVWPCTISYSTFAFAQSPKLYNDTSHFEMIDDTSPCLCCHSSLDPLADTE